MTENQPIQVTVCGGGNQAHLAACIFGSQPNVSCNVFTRQPQKWTKQIIGHPIENSPWAYKGQIVGKLNIVSNDAKEVCKGTKLFILCCPAFAYDDILRQIAQYIEKDAYLGSAYAQGCFNVQAINIIGKQKFENYNLKVFGLFSVPSVAFTKEYGKSVTIYVPKKALRIAVYPQIYQDQTLKLLNRLFQIPTIPLPNFLSLSLVPSNQIIHPSRMFGLFENWDGKSIFKKENVPLLYQDFDEKSAYTLENLCSEIQKIRRKIEQLYPTINLTSLIPLQEQLITDYGDNIKDKTNLQSCFQTNLAYKGLKIPLLEVPDGLAVNTKGRFFTEDIPYGLCIVKNIAQFAGVDTPFIDKVIRWHQKHMNMVYIQNDQPILNENTIHLTGAPKKYNINSLQQMLQFDNLGSDAKL